MALPKRYNPFEEMRRLQREMDDMFTGFFERSVEGGRSLISWGLRVPLSDIEDTGNAFKVTAELPGLEKEDINIKVDKDSIEISAERKDVKESKEKSFYYCERSYSGYRRRFGLPAEIDTDKVDAVYKDGILHVTLKKLGKEKKKVKDVKIK
jgi:HSP20 family protein